MKRIVISLWGLFLTSVCFGQELPKITPHSPNAASLMQYADIPVSNYTGIPNISIPLFTAKTRDITLPISLNYHSSGIKVAQEASWVGLGWALNAGGIISRQIIGVNDLESHKGFIDADPLPPFADETFDPISSSKLESYYREGVDSQPDMFYYNFLGHSGKFVFNKQSGNIIKPIVLEQNNLDISYNRKLETWTVIDGNGWVYTFKDKEISRNYSSNTKTSKDIELICCASLSSYISSWYLSKIETPTNDVMTFYYDNEKHATASQVHHSEIRSHLIHDGGAANYSAGDCFLCVDLPFDTKGERFGSSQRVVDDVYLRRIEFNTGSVVFNSEERTDLIVRSGANPSPPQRLKSMELFDSNNNSIKKVTFNYGYTTRLKLNSIQESFKNKDQNNYSTKPPYLFSYNNQKLPKQNSYAIDHYGYYNGQNSNDISDGTSSSIFVPFYDYVKPTGPGTENFYPSARFEGADRQTYAQYMDAEILEKITYPTGGQVRFEFEPNSYFVEPTYKLNKVSSFVADDSSSEDYKIRTFTLTDTTFVDIKSSYRNDDWTPGFANDCSGNANAIMWGKVVLKNANGGIISHIKAPYEAVYYQKETRVLLPPGAYSIEADNADNDCLEISANYSYNEKIPITEKEEGGLRIASIKTYDTDGAFLKAKKYTYTDSEGKSTGKLLTPVSLIGYAFGAIKRTPYKFFPGTFLVRNSTSVFPLSSSAKGNPIGYSQVTVEDINTDGTSVGRSEYVYINNEDVKLEDQFHGDDIILVSIATPRIVDMNNGKVLQEQQFDAEGQLVREKKIEYQQAYDSATKVTAYFPGIVFSKRLTFYLTFDFGEMSEIVRKGALSLLYDNFSQWWYPKSETETIYDQEGSHSITTHTTYEYGNASHKNLTQKEVISSRGTPLITTYEYPSDFPTETGMLTTVFDQMISQNILNPVIKQETKMAANLLASQITAYKDWGTNSHNSANLILPEQIKTSKGSDPLENKITYQDYYDNGNIKQVSKAEGTPIFYIWGYNESQPIAKIENFTSTDAIAVQGFIDEAVAASDNDSTQTLENTLRDKLKLLQQNIPEVSQMTYYTYDPLIGVTSITDPRGQTVYYEYDAFNRLEKVKDQNGRVLSKNEYHYKNR